VQGASFRASERALEKRPILVVEGNTADEKLILDSLHRAGSIDTGELPCLVFLELTLPKQSGFEVLQRIRNDARTRYLPVIVLSSSSELEQMHRCYDLGANSYVRKPAAVSEFDDVIRQALSYWLAFNKSG
jgi:two-component system response regulator